MYIIIECKQRKTKHKKDRYKKCMIIYLNNINKWKLKIKYN